MARDTHAATLTVVHGPQLELSVNQTLLCSLLEVLQRQIIVLQTQRRCHLNSSSLRVPLTGLRCGRIYHWDASPIQVGHAKAALSHWITLSQREAQMNKNPTKCEPFLNSDREGSFLTNSEAFLKYFRAVSLFCGRYSLPSEYICRMKESYLSETSNRRSFTDLARSCHSPCRGKPSRGCFQHWPPG